MADLGMTNSGPKESDNRDKSLHWLMVALAMAGIIAGSVILFAYASSYDSVVSDGTAPTTNKVELRPELNSVVVEKVVDEPMYAEKIKYINSTAVVEKPVYKMTTKVEKEVPAYTEREAEENVYMNETTDEPTSSTPIQSEEQEEKDDDLPEESELDDIIPKRLLRLPDEVVDFDDDEKHKDDENKGND